MEGLTQRVLREYPGEMHWNVPLFLNNDKLAMDLLNVSKIMFNVKPFDSVYGGFRCNWSGGRGSVRDDIVKLGYVPGVREFNSQGVTVWLTFSRYHMKDNMVWDDGCWALVNSLQGQDWGAIVANDELASLLKDRDIKTKASVIKFTMEYDNKSLAEEASMYINALESGLYDFIVPRPEFFVMGGAEMIPDVYRDRVEILVNQVCAFNCRTAKRHYELIEDFEETGVWPGFECNGRKSLLECGNNCCIDYESICKLNRAGYTRYKLQGRGLTPRCAMDQVGSYIYEPTGVIHILGEQIVDLIKKEQMEFRNLNKNSGVTK